MLTIYRARADELDARFLESIKAAYQNEEVEITICEVDETGYLLRSPANRERLLKAVDDIENSHNLVTPDQAPFQ